MAAPAVKTNAKWAWALLFVSCASFDNRAAIDVDVQFDPPHDRWTASYQLQRPATTVRFLRPRFIPRSERWSILEPHGAAWSKDGDVETIRFARPTSRLVLQFPTDSRELPKDYELNYTFNDGGRLLYTEHLAIAIEQDARPRHRWTFRTTPAQRIVTVGHQGVANLRWSPDPEPEDGTYVYFGPAGPIDTERMQMLLDPGMPKWIAGEVRELLPRQFDFFARMTGFELDFKPLIFLTYQDSDKRGLVFSGGTLPGVLVAGLEGRSWLSDSPQASEMWFFHLAHEAFHLSNGEMFQPLEDAQWLSEGSADYFALLAAREAGVMDQNRVEQRLIDAANRCVQQLGDSTSLAGAGKAGKFTAYYGCGNVISFAADRAIQRRSQGESHIGTLFHRIFADALESRHYSAADFLRELKLLAEPKTSEAIERIIDSGLGTEPVQTIAALLDSAGLAVEVSSGKVQRRK